MFKMKFIAMKLLKSNIGYSVHILFLFIAGILLNQCNESTCSVANGYLKLSAIM
jgi:hypothetical protein